MSLDKNQCSSYFETQIEKRFVFSVEPEAASVHTAAVSRPDKLTGRKIHSLILT